MTDREKRARFQSLRKKNDVMIDFEWDIIKMSNVQILMHFIDKEVQVT